MTIKVPALKSLFSVVAVLRKEDPRLASEDLHI